MNGTAIKFDSVSISSSSSNKSNNVKNNIFGSYSIQKLSINFDQHILGFDLGKSLEIFS